MDLRDLYYQIIDYAQANPLAAFATGFVLICFLIWRPKLFFILLIVALGATAFLKIVFEKLAETGL